MEYVIGWMKLKPGTRAVFLAATEALADASRLEPGVTFFEFHVSPTDPDMVLVVEGYRDAAAHEAHVQSAHFRAALPVMLQFIVDGRFENIFAERTRLDRLGPT